MTSPASYPDESRIQAAIEGLYSAFADAKLPNQIDLSPFKDPADFAVLTRVPLRELTPEQLWQYSFSVFLTVGDISDFEYFFPRIIELATAPAVFLSELEICVVFQKPSYAGWPYAWRKDRRKAFQAYLETVTASWASVVWQEIADWICALSFCLDDLDSRLDILLSGTDAANQNLIRFHEANREKLPKHRLANAFWDRSSPMHARIVAWLERPDVQLRIQQLYDAGVGLERFEA